MASVGELVIELVVDAKKGTAVIQKFGEVVEKTATEAERSADKLLNRF